MLPDCWVSHFLKCLWTTAEHHVEHLPSPERVDNTIRNVRKRSNSRLCQRVEWQQRTWPESSDTTPLLTSAEAQKQSWEKLLVPQWRDVLLRSSTHSSQFIFYPAAKWKSLSFKHFNTMFSAAGHRQACSPTQSFLFFKNVLQALLEIWKLICNWNNLLQHVAAWGRIWFGFRFDLNYSHDSSQYEKRETHS